MDWRKKEALLARMKYPLEWYLTRHKNLRGGKPKMGKEPVAFIDTSGEFSFTYIVLHPPTFHN
jgi:hypothetical protein